MTSASSADSFAAAVARAVDDVVEAAALLDRDGNVVAAAGALTDDDLRAIAGVLTHSLKGEALATRLLDGELYWFDLDDRAVSVGVAGQCVFVVTVFSQASESARARATRLNQQIGAIARALQADVVDVPPPRDSGGTPSGPAQLPVIELGVTVGRKPDRGKA